MPDEAEPAANNGDIFARAPTMVGAILAAKIVLFLLGISISPIRPQGPAPPLWGLRGQQAALGRSAASSQMILQIWANTQYHAYSPIIVLDSGFSAMAAKGVGLYGQNQPEFFTAPLLITPCARRTS